MSSSTRPTARRGRSAPSSRARCSRRTPATPRYARAATALADRDFVVAANADGPLTDATLAGADVLVIAHPSDPTWERTTGTGSPRLERRRARRDRGVRRARRRADRARRDRAGQVRQQPQRAARAASACASRTTPSRTTSTTATPRAGSSPSCSRAARGRGGDLLAARRRAVPLPGDDDRARATVARVLARTHATASRPGRAADRGLRRTARAASSCSPTPTCSATTASASSTTARCG